MNNARDNVSDAKEVSNSEQETNFQIIRKYMLSTLKDMYSTLRHPKFNFARSGIVISVILLVISSFFFLGPYLFSSGRINLATFTIYPNALAILISIAIAFVEIYLWFLVGIKVTPKAAHYLVDNKVLKLVFTKGNVHYIEYVPKEKRKITMPHILSKYIALIIAWVSLSAFILQIIAGIILSGNPTRILNPGSDLLLFIIRTVVIFGFVPLLFTLVYPVGWMLIDAKLKAYNSFSKLNWLVGKKVITLTAGIVTIGSIVGLGANLLDDSLGILERVQLIIDLILFCVINVSLTVTLVAIFYNVFFQGTFYERIVNSIDIGYGITNVTLVNGTGEPIPKDKKVKSASEDLTDDIESDQIDTKDVSTPHNNELSSIDEDKKPDDLEADASSIEE